MTSIPATVTITDLPAGGAVTGTELFEAVQTSGGVGNSVQLTLSQMVSTTMGALPSGGGTGQVLESLGTGFAAAWTNLSSLVSASTGISVAGSTTLAVALATASGLSVLGVAGTSQTNPLPIVGTAAQVFRVNDAGTAAGFGALNLASAAAVTGVLPGANFSAVNLSASGVGGVQGILQGANLTAVNLSASGAGGVQGVLQAANITAISVATTGAGGIQGQPFFLPTTALPASGASTMGIRISSASLLGIYFGTGAPTFAAGTSSLYLRNDAATATTRLYVNTNGSTTWANFTASA